jgi:hypothetical protein
MSALTEANYDGYSRQEVVWYKPYQGTGGPAILQGASLLFAPTDALSSNTIQGIFLSDSAVSGAGDLWAGQVLPAPGIVLQSPLTVLKVLVEIWLTQQQVYGMAAIFS